MAETGFVISDNLRESDETSKDTRIIDNLGGEGTADNFQLFSGNLRRESSIEVGNNVSFGAGGFVQTNAENGVVAFSNGTKLTIYDPSGNEINSGTVVSSNGIDRFTMENDAGVIPFAPGSASGSPSSPIGNEIIKLVVGIKFTRSDAITKENLQNLKIVRLETIDSGSSIEETEEPEFLSSVIAEGRNVASDYEVIDNALASFYFKRNRVIRSYEDSDFDRNIAIRGNIRIVDDSQVTRSSTSPGLFIVQNGSAERAFEGTDNPWSETGSALATTSNTEVATLTMTNPDITSLTEVSSANGAVSDATHKIPVEITDSSGNVETYFFLLKEI